MECDLVGPGHEVRAEADAFFATLDTVSPQAVTACRGWTAHEVIAHLASGADALANQIEAHFEHRAIPEFGAWEQRELPYQAIADHLLRGRLVEAEQRMSAAFGGLLKTGPETTVEQIGFGFPIGELVLHMRQEFAVHLWDLAGDNAETVRLLGQPELLAHSVRMLSQSLMANGLERDPHPGAALSLRVRCAGHPDLLVTVQAGRGQMALVPPSGAADVIVTDPAARLLLVWGRHPSDSRRVRSLLPPDALMRVQTILAGY